MNMICDKFGACAHRSNEKIADGTDDSAKDQILFLGKHEILFSLSHAMISYY